jgi:hypothetical protein
MDIDFADSTVVVASTNQVSCPLGDEIIILDLKAGLYFGLDNVGAKIWELVQQPRTIASLREAILDGFEVSGDVCQRDLVALLRELLDRNLIELRNATAV